MKIKHSLVGLLRTTTPDVNDVAARVWAVEPSGWVAAGRPGEYGVALIEQYKCYVEMADRVSARRMLANTFFLTLNTAVFTLFGVFWQARPQSDAWWLLFPLLALLTQTFAWFWILRSYRQLNAAKYAVVGVLEQRLPASPYWCAEWQALGEGRDPSRYIPLTHIEQWVPIVFALTYISAFVAALIF